MATTQVSHQHLLNPPLADKRDILLFFKGDMGRHRLPIYSRGVRQRIFRAARSEQWWTRYDMAIGDGEDFPDVQQGKGGEVSYSGLLARSIFCLVLPGDGWSGRAEDAVVHGCIPLIIMDEVEAVWESILDYSQFSIRVAQKDVERLPEILGAVTRRKTIQMQKRIRDVWQRFVYLSHPLLRKSLAAVLYDNENQWRMYRPRREEEEKGPQSVLEPNPNPRISMASWMDLYFKQTSALRKRALTMRIRPRDDAFHTIMQWLYGRIPYTR